MNVLGSIAGLVGLSLLAAPQPIANRGLPDSRDRPAIERLAGDAGATSASVRLILPSGEQGQFDIGVGYQLELQGGGGERSGRNGGWAVQTPACGGQWNPETASVEEVCLTSARTILLAPQILTESASVTDLLETPLKNVPGPRSLQPFIKTSQQSTEILAASVGGHTAVRVTDSSGRTAVVAVNLRDGFGLAIRMAGVALGIGRGAGSARTVGFREANVLSGWYSDGKEVLEVRHLHRDITVGFTPAMLRPSPTEADFDWRSRLVVQGRSWHSEIVRESSGWRFVEREFLMPGSLNVTPDVITIGTRAYRRIRSPEGLRHPSSTMTDWIGFYESRDGMQLRILQQSGRLTAAIGNSDYCDVNVRGSNDAQLAGRCRFHARSLELTRQEGLRTISLMGHLFSEPPVRSADIQSRARARGVARLLKEARQSTPVNGRGLQAPDLVPLSVLAPAPLVNLAYSTSENFLGEPIYPPGFEARLERSAATNLEAAGRSLAKRGLQLLIYDAFRPWSVSKAMREAAMPDPPVGPDEIGSPHNRGSALDVGLAKNGQGLTMPSEHDEFSPKAVSGYRGGTERQRWNRDDLIQSLEAHGFAVSTGEWWHFDSVHWTRFRLTDGDARP